MPPKKTPKKLRKKTLKKPEKMDLRSKNSQEDLVSYLKDRSPEIFTEGKIDVKKLKRTLGEEVESGEERYGLNWAGKSECFKRIQETVTDTFRPIREESVDFDNTQNLFLEGDNLMALKALERSYQNKVKMIYIDPPYNTGNDFIYDDNFAEVKKEYLKKAGAIDDEGNVLEDGLYHRNTKDGGHYHSNWLNMMYPRLFVARNLLRPDGVIFVSIDDNEVKNLRMIMDEIFGEENFLGCLTWVRRTKPINSGDARYQLQKKTEYIAVYARSLGQSDVYRFLLQQSGERKYNHVGSLGKCRLIDIEDSDIGQKKRETMKFPILGVFPGVGKRWKKGKDEIKELLTKGRIKNIDGKIKIEIYPEDEDGYIFSPFWSHLEGETIGTAEAGKAELNKLMGENLGFETVKPVGLLKHLLLHTTSDQDTVLDFFAGSGTLAHAVMQLNAEDGGNRKWICVQLPEKCDEKTEAAKAGFATIADIAKERIRRAAPRVLLETTVNKNLTVKEALELGKKGLPKDAQSYLKELEERIDMGFRVFKLDESRFKVWDPTVSPENLEQQMIEFLDNVRKDAKNEDLLYELVLKSGHELTVPIEEKKADKKTYFSIGDGSVVIILDKVTMPMFEEILKDKPKKVIALERAFSGDDVLMTNIYLRSKDEGVEEMRVV